MNCGQARRLFSPYWDDEITQAERESLERHFTACQTCREAYEELARSLEAVGSLPRVEASPDFETRVLARVRRARSVPDVLPHEQPRWVYAVATVAAVALAAYLGYRLGSAPRAGQPTAGASAPVAAAPMTPALPEPAGPGRAVATNQELAAVPDSVFDRSKDVDFVLDPVVLYRGRPRSVAGMVPDATRGQQVVITF
jgi:anti-sigma factor RsiW